MDRKKQVAEQLAKSLDNIACGHNFSSAILHAAHDLKSTTDLEKLMIRRWLIGTEYSTDHIDLQQLANKIRNMSC